MRGGDGRAAAPRAHQVHPRADHQAGEDLQQAQVFGGGRTSKDSAEAQPYRNSGEGRFHTHPPGSVECFIGMASRFRRSLRLLGELPWF